MKDTDVDIKFRYPHVRLYCLLMSEKSQEQLHNHTVWKKLTILEFKHSVSVNKNVKCTIQKKFFSHIIKVSVYNFIRKSKKKNCLNLSGKITAIW